MVRGTTEQEQQTARLSTSACSSEADYLVKKWLIALYEMLIHVILKHSRAKMKLILNIKIKKRNKENNG